jgi:hypothetical protein
MADAAAKEPLQSVQVFGRKKSATAVAYCKRGKGLIKVTLLRRFTGSFIRLSALFLPMSPVFSDRVQSSNNALVPSCSELRDISVSELLFTFSFFGGLFFV